MNRRERVKDWTKLLLLYFLFIPLIIYLTIDYLPDPVYWILIYQYSLQSIQVLALITIALILYYHLHPGGP